ncbi:hypothetical protein KCU88_g46, partial [Aureobasidium melanogenum]
MSSGQAGNWVLLNIVGFHGILTGRFTFFLAFNIGTDGFLDGKLDCSLSDEAQIGTGKAVRLARNKREMLHREEEHRQGYRDDQVGKGRYVLLRGHAVHFSQKLVDNTVRCATSVTHRTTTRLGNRIKLVKEDHARRSVEQDTARWRKSKLEELLGVFDGILDGFDEFALDGLETTNVVPANVGNFDHGDFAKC